MFRSLLNTKLLRYFISWFAKYSANQYHGHVSIHDIHFDLIVIQLESQNVAQTFCTDIHPGLQCSQSFNRNEIKCYLNGFQTVFFGEQLM